MKKPRLPQERQPNLRGHGVPDRISPTTRSGGSGSFACPACGHRRTTVYDSRPMRGSVKRARACFGCGHRFTTWECEGAAPDTANVAAHRVITELREMANRIERLVLHTDDREAAD